MKVSDLRSLIDRLSDDDEILVHIWTHDDALEICEQLEMTSITRRDWVKVIREFNRKEGIMAPLVSFIENRIARYTDELEDEYDEEDEIF